MEKINLQWGTPEHSIVANALGYNTHNKYMRKYSEPYFNYTTDADIALQIVPADKFIRVPNKLNVLFTMWEFLDVPQCYIRGLKAADAVIVPSRFCKEIFSKIIPANKIWVCFEGVDEEVFTYKERQIPSIEKGEKFRFLWVGAPNPRKGYPFVLEAIKVFERFPEVEIYVKTTMPKITWKGTIHNIWKNRKKIFCPDGKKFNFQRAFNRIPQPPMNNCFRRIGKHKNIIFDTRFLSTEQLVDMYKSAHCFLLPTLGEGWGLTLCEAMATGCPSIATAVTGCADYFNDKVGYPINYSIFKQDLGNYDLKEARGYLPSTKDFVEKMMFVCRNYAHAKKKGLEASERIRQGFTWKHSGKRLYDCISEIQKKIKYEQEVKPEVITI